MLMPTRTFCPIVLVLLFAPTTTAILDRGTFWECLCRIPLIKRLNLSKCNRVKDPLGIHPTIYSNPYDGRVFSLEYNGTNITLFGSKLKEIDVPLSMVTQRYVSLDGCNYIQNMIQSLSYSLFLSVSTEIRPCLAFLTTVPSLI